MKCFSSDHSMNYDTPGQNNSKEEEVEEVEWGTYE